MVESFLPQAAASLPPPPKIQGHFEFWLVLVAALWLGHIVFPNLQETPFVSPELKGTEGILSSRHGAIFVLVNFLLL